MTRRPAPGRRLEPELQQLINWLLRHKGDRTYEGLARRCHYDPSTLRRAVDGRMPTQKVVEAFARAAGADPREALRLLRAAQYGAEAAQVAAARAGLKPYVPGRIASLRGLAAAMRRVRQEAGSPSLRTLEKKGADDLPRSTLTLVLRAQRLPTARLLAAFLTACHATEQATTALTAARDRLDPHVPPPPRPPTAYLCADTDPELQAALERQERAREIRTLCGIAPEEEEDWYDQQLREEEARLPPWGWTDAEIEAWEAEETPPTDEEEQHPHPATSEFRPIHKKTAAQAPRTSHDSPTKWRTSGCRNAGVAFTA
ncbi:helix-turn-helix domain-containing protein [Streptomyces sp. NPDC002133]|uniref:helix-turn-helix domain-containing protein n=1 Tax=Streptomyces sp. NPDC002133 TaxID=3154409 RepID=UPI003316A3B4